MRKETWFRGPLLSGLFFSLLIGGAPSIAAADLQSVSSAHQIKERQGPCQTPGHVNTSSGCISPNEMNHHNRCDMYGDAALLGGVGTIVSTGAVFLPELLTTFFGGLGLLTFGPTAVVGGLGWVWNDC